MAIPLRLGENEYYYSQQSKINSHSTVDSGVLINGFVVVVIANAFAIRKTGLQILDKTLQSNVRVQN